MKKYFYLCIPALFLLLHSCGDANDEKSEATIEFSSFTETVDENPKKDAVILTIKATVSDKNLAITYSIISQDPAGAFSLDASSGQLKVADPSLFDYEKNKQLTANIQAKSGSKQATAKVTVILSDVNENVAPVIWSGQKKTFTKTANSDWNVEANQDRITPKVWLTRAKGGGGLFNAVSESKYSKGSSPTGTEWALGTTKDIAALTFKSFHNTAKPKTLVSKDMVLRLVEENIYIDIKIKSWGQGKDGAFSYERSTK